MHVSVDDVFVDLRMEVADAHGTNMDELFDDCTRTGLLLPLDGLDEVRTVDSARMLDALNGLARLPAERSGRTTVMVTMRSQLPDTRAGFYAEIIKELLVDRRVRQHDARDAPRTALLDQRQTIFGRLAFENMIDPDQHTNPLSCDRALAVTAEVTDAAEPRGLLLDLEFTTGIFAQAQDHLIAAQRGFATLKRTKRPGRAAAGDA